MNRTSILNRLLNNNYFPKYYPKAISYQPGNYSYYDGYWKGKGWYLITYYMPMPKAERIGGDYKEAKEYIQSEFYKE